MKPAEHVGRAVDGSADIFLLRHISCEDTRAHAVLLDLVGHVFQDSLLRRQVVQADVVSVFGEAESDGFAEALGSAGDEGDAAWEGHGGMGGGMGRRYGKGGE